MRRRVEGKPYGQRLPPLTSILKSILERYPDGGQILKEIIQNADDASATTVSFLLDSRGNPYGKTSLYKPELAKFQGPALYSFNDAVFQEEDWDGLQKLMDSNKKEEPLKVGRFGIGFNSIYHVTDLPSIVSGDQIAFLDPHEKYFGLRETGEQFDLRGPLLQDYRDQFSPYEDILGCKISAQFVNGTLFRFPLRVDPSKLSQKPYTTENVRSLFQSLKDEASLILLFLKNIEEINIFETDENHKEKLVFRVRLHDSCRKQVRENRQNMLRRVPEWQDGRQKVIQLNLEMVIEIFDNSTGTHQDRWITHNRIGDEQAKLRQNAIDLNLLPWVGFASPLTANGGRILGSNGGRIFCFLPLPPDADARTGYPVHIHGYFGLTDNRRGLKWPGPECQNDDMAEWNKNLMTYVGSQAYASLLQAMAAFLPNSPDMVSIFYQCWPDKQHVNKHWKDIIDSVFRLLLSKSVFWTGSNGGRWLNLQEAALERLRDENLPADTKALVKKVLLLANKPVVSLPLHVDEYMRGNANTSMIVTPTYFRAILKKNQQGSWNMETMNRQERIAMLEYIVSDNNFADFQGINLLPLANGRFTAFKAGRNCSPNDMVYVETQDNKMTLLPRMESRFLDSNIRENVLLRLTGKAVDPNKLNQSYLQLVHLNPPEVISLLPQVLPKDMFLSPEPAIWDSSNGNHPSESWLVEFWKWLNRTFPYDLSQLEGFPLIKCSFGQHTALAKLKRNTKIIRQQNYEPGASIRGDVVSILKKAGIIVLSEVPDYMRQHACFSIYVADASPEGVLKVLRNAGSQQSIAAARVSNAQEKRSLRSFLSSLRVNLSNDEKQFLKSLPIFEAIDKTSFISSQNKSSTAPCGFDEQIPLKIKNASTILSVEDNSSNMLLKKLDIPEMTMGQFLTTEILSHLLTQSYTVQQITSLMCWVLRRIDVFRHESSTFCPYISSLKFVDAGQGTLLRPQDLFNPQNKINKRLFEGQDSKFPFGEFAKDDIIVPLRSLGLKELPDPDDIVFLAETLPRFNTDQRRRKAVALLEYLGEYPSILSRNINNGKHKNIMLQNFLRNVTWVPSAECPPPWYPKCMPWESVGNGLLKPDEIVASQYGVVVGANMSVLESDPNSQIKSIFGWEKTPHVSKILEQLKTACTKDNVESLQGIEREKFCGMLMSIYKALAASTNAYYINILLQETFPAFVWNGQRFSSPSKIAFRRETNFDPKPYLHIIPKEMQEGELHAFFSQFGLEDCFTEKHFLGVLCEIKVKHDNMHMKLNKELLSKDRQLALDILHWIVRDGPLDVELRDNVCVPVMNDPGTLKLVPLTECTFCDAAWLRGNFVELQMLSGLSELSLIDESISNTTASHLGVPPMSKCVTAPEMLGFEQAGPYEPITTRLKNILDEYKEGAGVFKELIQNADDAGATEVKMVIDWRRHPDKKLLAEGMKETQGPALLAYNNAVFTKKDFENINKLAGATKKEDLDKIGRFGLGFNSVYHFTDTPSFLSSNYAVFFDPDTKHLGHFITSPSHPGIKLNLALNRNTLLYYPDQFQPYHGFFGCDVNGERPFYFEGTLFRFPFRRWPGEICDKQYNKSDVDALLESFNRSASILLLNTQYVQHVSIWELDQHAENPSDMQPLIKVDRKALSDPGSLNDTTFLQECAEWSKREDIVSYWDKGLPQRIKIISTTHTTTKDEMKPKTEYWLQCDRMGEEESLEMAASEEGKAKGLLSCAGVAVKLERVVETRDSWKTKNTNGEAFCFLPLSILTGLPVHVNGYFAVTSNRRGIWEPTAEESQHFQPVEARWNKALMKDGIAHAYLELLKEAKRMAHDGILQGYSFCSLWPNPDLLQSKGWMPLVVGVYSLIESSSLPLLKCGSKWYSVDKCDFPDTGLQEITESLQILQDLGYKIVNLPQFARRGFKLADCGEQIEKQTMSQEKFLKDVFFPNINAITAALRDKVVCYVIDGCLTSSNESKKELFQQFLRNNACIPCSLYPKILALPRDLIHPYGAAATLYSPSDNKMPVGDGFIEEQRLLALQKLDMVKDKLNWDQICDRARSVMSFKYGDGLKRVSNLITYLNNHISEMPPANDPTRNYLTSLSIFPVMEKPKEHFFPWAGERNGPKTMLPSNELFDKAFIDIIGSLKPILDESEKAGCGKIEPEVQKLFQISDHQPVVEEALTQLLTICEHFKNTDKCLSLQRMTTDICNKIYSFLQSHIGEEDDIELMKYTLQDSSWLFVEDRFVKSEQLAFEWDGFGTPYLYRVPRSLVSYTELLSDMGVKRTFDVEDFLFALKEMETQNEDLRLNDADFKVSKEFLDELNKLDEIPDSAIGCTPIPGQDRILRLAQELVINDAPWITMYGDMNYVHTDISINLAFALGAKDVRSKSLEDISRSVGQPFGQKELLTDRLSGILESYPCDFGILKELLQNADDAKATEIHFVYDSRHHSGERVFSESWKELQGPALCVYNNCPFSDKDLEGIQRLGIGSKGDSPEKTGQYGIGFNAVYHLTDCPSFITDGNTLCILDPHARYAPGATKGQPGRIIGPLGSLHKENYRDVFPGYLGDMFELQGATMFRFPLRNKEMAKKSEIYQKEVISLIKALLINFKWEAKETLLFLNYVKKISISTVEEDELKLMYEVSADLEEEDENKRSTLADHVKKSKHLQTNEIERFDIFYPITLKDTFFEEKWLVQQTLGVCSQGQTIRIPDGKSNGLLPRAGVAAKVISKQLVKSIRPLGISSHPEKRKAFCFLPLPVTTGLPLHVNGHFALDSGRRHLWQDEDGKGFRTEWNQFMKTEVIAQVYVSLLFEARHYIPHLKHEEQSCFSRLYEANIGLQWYEGLFPSQEQAESQWKELVVAVLNKITHEDKKVLPLLRKATTEGGNKLFCSWLSPSESFFPTLGCDWDVSNILRTVGFNLVSLKYQIYDNFKKANTSVKEVAPEPVLKFLSNHKPLLEQLPCPIGESSIGRVADLLYLLDYCKKSPTFVKNLNGVPLLHTRDGILRVFSQKCPVYISTFSHLVPSSAHYERFAANHIVTALKPLCKELFHQSPAVALPLKLSDLATFLRFIFQEYDEVWFETNIPVSWDPKKNDREIKKWLIDFWSFVSKKHKANPSVGFLEPVRSWPVIPTTSKNLLPVSLSKTVFDLRGSESWSTNLTNIVYALLKLGCPEVDMDLIESKAINVSEVVKTYLAYPSSANDVITVLDSLMKSENDISGRIDDVAATLLLQFLQEDYQTLRANPTNLSVLRKLPFYKTIDGRLIKLEGAFSVCKVPYGIPLEESDSWMEGTRNIFIEPCQSLDLLHESLGVKLKSHASCYTDFIFPKFSQLQESTRILHLLYIKNNLFHTIEPGEVAELESALKKLKFIPNASGELYTASHYYHRRNSVFKYMLSKDKFPGKPFCEQEWGGFLCRIGLQTTFSEDEFVSFVKEIEKEAEQNVTKSLVKKSQVLTQYLLQEEALHDVNFLNKVSTIKFVVAHKADENFIALIKQFLSEEKSFAPIVCFRNSLQSKHEILVWGSAALLPDWAWPSEQPIRKSLGILENPTLEQVQNQVQRLCRKFDSKDMDLKECVRQLLLEIMSKTYSFLQEQMYNSKGKVHKLFHCLSLVLADDERVFVRCEQLAFEMATYEEQPPYLYKVPRVFGQFEDLFNCLGAFEKPHPTQYSFILQRIWRDSKGEELHEEEMRHVKGAVRGLFRTLKRLHTTEEHAKPTTCLNSLQSTEVIYLPNEKKQLKPSNLLHYASFQLLGRIDKAAITYDLLYDVNQFPINEPEKMLSYLPPRLQVTTLSQILAEDVHSDCFDKKCKMDDSEKCKTANRLRALLESNHLIDGVIRILKSQDPSKKIEDEVRTRVESLRTVVMVVCFESLETVLRNDKDEEAQGSKVSKTCFAKDDGIKMCIFIQHGASNIYSSVSYNLCLAINRHIGNAINLENYSHLEFIIVMGILHGPKEIPSILDGRQMEPDMDGFRKNVSERSRLGSLIPEEWQYLLVQFEDFLFRPDEIVGYEQEDRPEDKQGKYLYARIVREISAPNVGGRTKKAKRDRSTDKRKTQSLLLRKYLIDIGTAPYIEVDALDLYKLKRPKELPDLNENTTNGDMSEGQAIAVFDGEENMPGSNTSANDNNRPGLPRTWNKAVKEVNMALADIIKLPKEQQKKALKRLYFRWHPDKNPDMEKWATEVMKYIQNEFKLLSEGETRGASNGGHDPDEWESCFRTWNQRASRQRASYDNYRRSNPGFTKNFSSSGGHGSNSGQSYGFNPFGDSHSSAFGQGSSSYHAPDAKLARVWLVQSRSDLESVNHLFSAKTPDGFYWLICFQCNQVVEKALKAALYSVSGISNSQLESNDLTSLAYDLKRLPRAPDVVHSAGKLWSYHDATRYPHKHRPAKPPKEVYSFIQAQEAYEIAKSVLKMLEEYIGVLHL